MMLLLAEIKDGLPMPNFGAEHLRHMSEKRHAGHRIASVSAWTLLEKALQRMNYCDMPIVTFSESGKPVFPKNELHFSLSHSGKLVAVLVSSENCAVDVEKIAPNAAEKLSTRCMHENEIAAGMDFFECWTKKECLAKLSGKGLSSRPSAIDLTQTPEAFFCRRILDSSGEPYCLSAITHESIPVELLWIEL